MKRLDALGNAALRSTLLFVRAQTRPTTADEVATALKVPRTVARSRLERLLAADLLVADYQRRSGRAGPGAGRPAKIYAAAAETTTIEFPPRRYESLIRLLVAALPRRQRVRQLNEIGYSFGLELARAARLRRTPRLATALERLCSGLGRLGFQAALETVTDKEAVIVSATCPLRPLIVASHNARAIDQGMWRGLIAAAAGEDAAAGVRCRTNDCLDATSPCHVVVSIATQT
jgi:predicted ArsR family transcriptional regulator